MLTKKNAENAKNFIVKFVISQRLKIKFRNAFID